MGALIDLCGGNLHFHEANLGLGPSAPNREPVAGSEKGSEPVMRFGLGVSFRIRVALFNLPRRWTFLSVKMYYPSDTGVQTWHMVHRKSRKPEGII
jgi:hypothetical protein